MAHLAGEEDRVERFGGENNITFHQVSHACIKFKLTSRHYFQIMLAPEDPIVKEAFDLAEEGNKKGVVLRLLGHTAVQVHCLKNLPLLLEMRKAKASDIDFVSYGKQKKAVTNFFAEKGYQIMQHITMHAYVNREIFTKPNGVHVDVFYDNFQFCHSIDFKNRLEADYPTIPLSELLLTKMQIVKINEKDIKDTIILLLEHKVGETDKETINTKVVAKVLSADWGFYYTVTTNLKKVESLLQKYEALTDENRKAIKDRIASLLESIEKEPKSMGWKMRAAVGTKKKWYNEVEDVERAEWLNSA